MLLPLGPAGLQVILKLANISWKNKILSRVWTNSIIPFFKNMPPEVVRNYYPILLTFNLGKMAGSMINRCLQGTKTSLNERA